jgi:hypothetical protein
MDKKRFMKSAPSEDLKGFEEFVEGQPENTNFLPRPAVTGQRKETSFENFDFLKTDGERLIKLQALLNEKLPFAAKYEQGNSLIKEQREEIQDLQAKIFEMSDKEDSAYRRSLSEIFDSFFEPPKPS